MNATAPNHQSETAPLDIETIKSAAQDVITNGAKIEDVDELETIILLLRGMIMLLIPEVEADLARYAKSNTAAVGARAGVQEARIRAHAVPGSSIPELVGHAQRLARGVLALIRHHEKLGGAA
ncbi:DUF6415 family natural product biosynthesis protein [Streptomyces sp. ATCC 21386]|uniref:DUF6415 family natural product biosynthesis protein n=1 Tax=Streptomyces sp. ATCC 21386 TaxID=2699428 RepID=UPI001BFF8698|nr:DUF6415 family natural product biosynthesis protein [Streptomyces sp. ATCC 21386]